MSRWDSRTVAVPEGLLALANPQSPGGMALCPRCRGGYLQPFRVTMNLRPDGGQGFEGADFLHGWVAVCHGNAVYREHLAMQLAAIDTSELTEQEREGWTVPDVELSPACGFWMQLMS